MNGLFGMNNGSTDESNIKITGFEMIGLFKYLKHKFAYFLLLIFYLIDSLCRLLRTVIQGKLTTVLVYSKYDSPDDFIDSMNYVSSLLLASIVGRFLSDIFISFMEYFFINHFISDLKVKILSKILEQDISYFDQTQIGVMISRITVDATSTCDFLIDIMPEFLYCLFDFVIGVVIGLIQSWQVTLIALTSFPIYGVTQYFVKYYVNRLYLDYNGASTQAVAKAEEILSSFRTVKPFDSELREYHSYRDHLFAVHHIILKASFVRATQRSVESMVQWGMTSFALYYAGIKAAQRKIDPGTIVTIITIIQSWSYSVSVFFSKFFDFRKANVSAAKLFEIINREPLIKLDEGSELNERIHGIIEFRNVSFKYPSCEEYTLRNMSFKIKKGETIALVGESGCGKSTTLQLIQRFYDVNEGQILVLI